MFRALVARSPLFSQSVRFFADKTSLEETVERKLTEALEPSLLRVIDHSGGCPGGTLEVEVHSEKFEGKNELQRSRQVQGLLKEEISTVHAFILRTKGPTKKE